MDAFWLLPVGVVALAILAWLIAHLMKQPESPGKPHVLLDTTSDPPPVDEATRKKDWSTRPCGSVLDWRSSKGE
jgi:hypothetical protein